MDGEQGDKDPATKVVPTPVRSSIPEPPVQTTVVVEKVEQQPAQQEEVPPNVNVNEDKTKLEQTPETDQPPLVPWSSNMPYLVHVLFKQYYLSNVDAQNQSLFKQCNLSNVKNSKSGNISKSGN